MRAFLSAVLMAAALMPFGLRPASAQGAEILLELIAQCHRDAADLCADIQPGGGRIAACLYSHMNDLSPPCHRAVRDGLALRACAGEYRQYCRDVPVGEGQIARCLHDFRDELSPQCEAVLAGGAPYSEPRYGYDRDRRPYARKYSDETYSRRHSEEPVPEDDDRGPDRDLK
jgi:hypothetical protein